jgi:hypothetical protein
MKHSLFASLLCISALAAIAAPSATTAPPPHEQRQRAMNETPLQHGYTFHVSALDSSDVRFAFLDAPELNAEPQICSLPPPMLFTVQRCDVCCGRHESGAHGDKPVVTAHSSAIQRAQVTATHIRHLTHRVSLS